MTDKASLEVMYRVYDDNEGVCLEVRPHPDFPEGAFMLHAPTDKDKEWWGAIELTLSKEFAAKLGEALIRATAGEAVRAEFAPRSA